MRIAAIGIGSNSLRMLLAEILDGKLYRLKRYREGLRLFAALNDQNCISSDMIALAVNKICDFCSQAKAEGAEKIVIFATSAVRDCRNQQEISDAILKATDLPLDICEGEREASLSYWGAFHGEKCGLIDIGGGSTEVIYGENVKINFAHSYQIGAVRLFREIPISCLEDAVKLKNRLVIQMKAPGFLPCQGIQWVGVGGTFTTSVALVTKKDWRTREHVDGFRLYRKDIETAIAELVCLPIEERLKLPYFQPQRADIIVHGLVILLACFDTWQIPEIAVSECGNLEGYLKYRFLMS